ncbi:MAG: hypothetical protein KIT72_11245 [Polyangiaceae bacterium]|nr:hypothetical protein [Polyangiaceae bacterium]MCW5790987.1 hypothetical protein [Polyangiaceae bacterium]
MAEEKKPKIDLKARLGKKTIAGPATGAVPPPVGIPKPVGVPAPPFATGPAQPARPAPRVDASDPYAAIAADDAPVRAEPAAIKIEMSEEVVKAQKKGKLVLVLIGVVGAAVGGLLGFTMGDRTASNAGAKRAIEDAARLAKEIDDANAEAEALAEVLQSAGSKLAASKFPEEEVSKLGSLRIGFSGANLASSNIGRFRGETVMLLVDYTSRAQEANAQKEKLQAVLSGSKKAITELLAESTAPKVRWSVYMQGGPRGPWAIMQPLPEPFLVNDKDKKDFKWPDSFKIKDGQKEFDLKRYSSGDPLRSSGDPFIIPVDPGSQGSVCPNDTMLRIRREVMSMQEILKGKKGTGADGEDEKRGLVDAGATLVEQLKAIGAHAGG